jgi:hypothetical protein
MEPFVAVGTSVWTFGNAAESIQVQLSLERRKLRMTKIPWQHITNKPVIIPNHKCISPGQPTNHT